MTEESEEYNLKQSMEGIGQLVPVIVDKKGRIVDGFHRIKENKDCFTFTIEGIETDQDLELARLAVNHCRRKVLASEMMQRIGFLIESGLKPEEICEKTGISRTTVYKYMPEELKDKEKAELGHLGGSASHANRTVETQETIKCEGCGIDTTEPETWNHPQTGPHQLCKECSRKATLNPDPYLAKFRKHLPIERKLTPNGNGTTTVEKPKETWAYTEGHMKAQKSKAETDLLKQLSSLGITPQTDFEICLNGTVPDGIYPDKKIAYYVDGEVHKGNVLDRDERITAELEKRGWTVLRFREGNAKEWATQIQEALKW